MDGRTDGQTSCHGIVRAMHTRRAVKCSIFCAYQICQNKKLSCRTDCATHRVIDNFAKSLKITQGYWKWHHSIWSCLVSFPRHSEILLKKVAIFLPYLHSTPPPLRETPSKFRRMIFPVRMVGLPVGEKFEDTFSRFRTIQKHDRRTDGRTPHGSIGSAMHSVARQ